MISLAARPRSLVVLGAHCDDIAIGAGASLIAVCSARPGVRVDALVLCGAGTKREDEEYAALAAFCPGAQLELTVLKLPDGRLPVYWDEVKSALEQLRARTDPDLLFAPHTGDAHQDHRLLAELLPTAFRGHLILGYEILKWDGDLGRPQIYQPLTPDLAERKASLLAAHYPSQQGRAWFDREAFLGLARIRGVECHAPYAEAFFTGKLVVDLRGG